MEWGLDQSQIVGRDECLHLLAANSVGRLAITCHALPHIVPVDYAVCANNIVIRTIRGSRVEAAARDSVVAFETDGFDSADNTAWSVSVTGVARPIEDSAMNACPDVWRGIARGQEGLLVIPTDLISGARTWTAETMPNAR